MELPRRTFLAGAGAAAGAALLPAAACTDDAPDRAAPGDGSPREDFDPSDWESVRAQLPLDDELAHFAAFVFATTPRPVAEAIDAHRRGLDADPAGYLAEHEADLDADVLAAAGEYLGVEPASVATTDSTTMGLGLVYGGLRLGPTDHVLTTEHDFYSTHESLRLAAARTGATVERVALYDDPAAATADDLVERLVAGVTPATKVVAVTWTHSSTGVKLPVRAIADALAERDEPPLLCVDAVHALGVEPEDLTDLGCDVLVAGTHKWLFGPRGTGIVWSDERAWAAMDPVIPPFEGTSFAGWIAGGDPQRASGGAPFTPGGYHTFEHRWALAEAFRFHLAIGKAAVHERTVAQATQLKAALAEVDELRVVTPTDPSVSSGIVCIETPGDPDALLEPLRDRGYAASVTPYRTRYLRLGPSIATTPEQVDGAVAALRDLI